MIYKYFYQLSVCIIGIVVAIFVLTCVGSLFHIPVNIFYVAIPTIMGIYYLKKQSATNLEFLQKLLLLLSITLISYFIAIFVWDFSWDGRSSHLATIIMYKEGWLPIYQNYKDFAQLCNIYAQSAFWGNCYLHFTEIVGANIYKITNLVESPKAINFIMLSCVFMYSCFVLKNFNPKIKFINLLVSTIIVLNPVCIYQWFTNYIDLQIYFAFTLLLMVIVNVETKNEFDMTDRFMFICSALMLATTKFTGSMYCFLISFIYLMYRLVLKKDIITYLKIIGVIVGLVLITSINPFYTNFRDYGNPFYPLFGKNKINILDGTSMPKGFDDKNYFERFIISNISESLNSIVEPSAGNMDRYDITPKIPFTINAPSYYHKFFTADMRIAGFGYYWSGILCLIFIGLFGFRFRTQKEKQIFILLMAILSLTVASNPQNWWARYVPQMWLIPVFILYFLLINNFYKNKLLGICQYVLLYLIVIVFLINSLIIFAQNGRMSLISSEMFKLNFRKFEEIAPKGVYVMRRPEWRNMVIADETIMPHLKEALGKVEIVPYNENLIIREDWIPAQNTQVMYNYTYYIKPIE